MMKRCLAGRVVLLPLLMLVLVLVGCGEKEKAEPSPLIRANDVRAGIGETAKLDVELESTKDVRSVDFQVDLRYRSVKTASIRAGSASPANTLVNLVSQEEGEPVFHFNVEAPEGQTLGNGVIASVTFDVPNSIQARKGLRMTPLGVIDATGKEVTLEMEAGTIAVSFFHAPVAVATFLAAVVALIYILAQVKALKAFFKFLPPLIWMYFIPMICTTVGILPDSSPFYSPFMSRVVLPAILILLLIPSDIAGLKKLGMKAVGMMLFGTFGIVIGAIGSFALFMYLMPDQIPEESWKGIAALSGSWIGGSPNMTAVFESVGTPPGILGPLIIVDTVLAYSWLGLLIALSTYQVQIDKKNKADTKAIEEISLHLEREHAANARTPQVADVAWMLGIALMASQLCLWLGGPIYTLFNDVLGMKELSKVVNSYGWGILLITAVGLLLSLTPARRLDYCGASSIGYVGLYLLLTTYGARADLRAVLEVPIFFAIGLLWIIIHVVILYIGLKVLHAPLFLAATSSMANIGGTASAPVVAASYNQSMAPVGLLMAILGGTLGTPLALFVVATACRAIQGG